MADFDPRQFDIQKFIKPFDIESQKGEGRDFTGRFGQAVSNLTSPALLQERYEKRFGVPQLQTAVNQLGEIGEQLRSQYLAQPSVVK
ncbi:MAG: hypothetical protein DRI61_14510, partial [Chloroflexi bacterium]